MKLSLKKRALKNLSQENTLNSAELPKGATPQVGGGSLHGVPRSAGCRAHQNKKM